MGRGSADMPASPPQGRRGKGSAPETVLRASADASAEEFELVGDYAMGAMLGSASAHESMDETMTWMMGAKGERQAHAAMGRRYAGCGGGQLPAGLGRMRARSGAWA